jgi:iron-sulfur cluster assembly protein
MNFAGITISEEAKNKLLSFAAKRPDAVGIRVSVATKGCSGMKYVFDYATDIKPAEDIIELDGTKLLIDPKATLFLFGAQLVWVKEQFREGFDFVNKNEKSRCGCGESFSV